MCEEICCICKLCIETQENWRAISQCTGQTGSFYPEACPNCDEYKGAKID